MRAPHSKTTRGRILLTTWVLAIVVTLSCSAVTSALVPAATATTAVTYTVAVPTGDTATPRATQELGFHSAWGKSRIAFASNRTGTFQIYSMKPDGTDLTQLTDSKGDNRQPAWTPDGKRLFFTSTRDGNSEIYGMNADGTQQVDITKDAHMDSMPVALPNNQLAFLSDRGGHQGIFVMNSDGTGLKEFSRTTLSSGMRMLCIVWYADADLFFTTEESSQRVTWALDMSNGDVWIPEPFAGQPDHSCPSVSRLRNSDWVMFVSNRSGHDEIYGFRESAQTDVQFTQESEPSFGLSRSADQSWITFYSKRTGNWDIYVMGIQGKYQWDITNSAFDDVDPAWQPY